MRLPELAGFKLEKLMGEDPFGWSYMAGNQTDQKRFVRILKSQATQDQAIAGTYQKITSLTNPGAIAPVEVFSQRMVGMPTTISHPFPGWKGRDNEWHLSSMADLSRMMGKEEVISAGTGIIHSLGTIHRQGIVHGGLHPKNIFLLGLGEEPEVKIIGFGEMVAPGLQHIDAFRVPFYMAPEQFVYNVPSRESVAQWDVYSLGIILYQMLSGHLPRLDLLLQQYRDQPEQLEILTLVSMGQLTSSAQQIHQLLQNERDLIWPDQHANEEEKVFRGIVEKCLFFDSSDRFTDMADVSNSLRQAHLQIEQQHAAAQVAAAQAQVAAEAARVTTPSHGHAANPGIGPTPQPQAPAAKPITQAVAVSAPPAAEEKVQEEEEKKTFETLDDIFDGEEANSEKTKAKGRIIGKLPVARQIVGSHWLDKSVAVILVMGFAALGIYSLFVKYKLTSTEQNKAQTVSTLKANIAKQADVYRQQLDEKLKSAAEMKEDLNEVEDTKAQLTSNVELARRLLRRSQESGDQFFRLILENHDTDVPGFREDRIKALAQGKVHYENLIEIYGDDPYFIVSKANSFYYLGRIHKELGDFDAALAAFSEAEYRYLALMEQDLNVEFTNNLAVSKRALGELALRNAQYSEASQFFHSSSQQYQALKHLDPSRELDLAIRINTNSLKIIECHQALNNTAVALESADTITSQFLKLQEGYPENERVIGGLASSFELLGKIHEQLGDGDKALTSYEQASALFGSAIKKNASVDKYHLGLGNCLARTGLLKNDFNKLEGSAKVLAQVISRNPHEPRYLATLADVYGALAANQRDGGKLTNATKLEEEAIALLSI